MADTNIKVKLNNVRLSFFHGYKPQERTDDKTKALTGYSFGATLMLDKVKDKALINQIIQAQKDAIAAKWPDEKTRPSIPLDRRPLGDGEPIDPDTIDPEVPGSGVRKASYEGWEGMMVVRSGNPVSIDEWEKDRKNPVRIIGPKKNKEGKFDQLKEGDPYAPYSGCYVNASIDIWAYDGTKGGHPHRVIATLRGIQFKDHGKAFGGRAPINAEEEFDEEDVSDDFSGDAGDDAGTPAKEKPKAPADDYDFG